MKDGARALRGVWAGAGVLMWSFAATSCNSPSKPEPRSLPTSQPSGPSITEAKRLSDGINKLIKAMKRPTQSFQFEFHGLENLNDDATTPPEIGAVSLSAEVSPQEIKLTEKRASTSRTSTAKRSDETNWEMVNSTILGMMTNPNLVIAMGATVASPPSTDLVGTTVADKFTFDTTTASEVEQRRLEGARQVLSTIKDCAGTAWIAEDSGLLVKFSVDADYLDKDHRAWKEHYEGVVLPK